MPKPFLVLSTIRSGSTHLTRLLNAHPQVVCNGEIFNDSDPDYNWPGYPPKSTKEMIEKAFVDFPGKEKDPAAVGCKLTDQPLFGEPTRLADLLALPDMKVIVLQRRNQVECLRSMLQAWDTSAWQQPTGRPQVPLPPVTLSPLAVKGFFERAESFYGKCSLLIPPGQRLWVDYDDLRANQGPVCAQLWYHLGVPPVAVEATLDKMEDRPLSETVENYEELQMLFEWTEYGVFLP
jgi:LPS sulfotransferase NodH